MVRTLSRRRFIGITAATAGLKVLPFGGAAASAYPVATWNGVVLGAIASIHIHHADIGAAEQLIAHAVEEIRRLERLFSLYKKDSVLVALNRRGFLEAPPSELVELLLGCRRYWELTDGAFDASVQPLWTLYANHFSGKEPDPDGPPPSAIQAARACVSFADVLIGKDRIAFRRAGMGLTLNGIAQGYVTDRVVALLRSRGIAHSLVDMGEARALGPRPDGGAWQVGITDSEQPDRVEETLAIVDQAVATSGGYGCRFEPHGRFHHLFDPKTGRSAALYRSVTVVMPTATAADALSTAFNVMPTNAVVATLRTIGYGRAHILTADGGRLTFES